MVDFNWEEYKEYKNYTHKKDKLEIAIDFMKSYYNMNNKSDMYEMLANDDIGRMMLDKREIANAEDLENFVFKS